MQTPLPGTLVALIESTCVGELSSIIPSSLVFWGLATSFPLPPFTLLAPLLHNTSTMLVVLLLGNPHLVERAK